MTIFTFSQWFLLGIILLGGLLIIGIIIYNGEKIKYTIYAIAATILALGIAGGAMYWLNTRTASGARAIKDFQSELNNGLNREITITAEDGREIFHYEGKIDIETDHSDNYIVFESEDGKRYMVYYGVQDTVTIIEK